MSPPSSPPTKAPVTEWVQAVLLATNLAWTTLCLGGLRADTMVVTSALSVLLLAVHIASRALGCRPRRWHPAGWLMAPFLGYAAANVFWVTPVPWLGWHDWLGWAQLVTVFWVVLNDVRSRSTQRFLVVVMLALGTVAVLLAVYQRFARPDWMMLGRMQREQFLTRSSGPFNAPNALAALMVLLIPPVGWLALRRSATAVARVGFGYLALLFLFGLGLTFSRGAWLSLAVATAAWPLLSGGRRWRRRIGLAGAVIVSLGVAGVAIYSKVPVARERFETLVRDSGERTRVVMWRAAWAIFREHPVVGGGAGSYNVLFEKYRSEIEQKEPQWTHNDYLNTLSDYGLVGFTAFFGAVGAVVVMCGLRRSRVQTNKAASAVAWTEIPGFSTASAIGLLGFSLNLMVDFHLKIPALALWVGVIAGWVVQRKWSVAHCAIRSVPADEIDLDSKGIAGSRLGSIMCGVVAIAIVVAGCLGVLPHYRSEALRESFREQIDQLARGTHSPEEKLTVARRAQDGFSRALAIDAHNYRAWSDRAYAIAIIGHEQPEAEIELGRTSEPDARRAVAFAPAVWECWLRLGVALDMQGRWLEAGEAFSEGLRLAPVNASAWFYYAYHLSLNHTTVLLARAAIATSLRLDPSAIEAEALRQHLAARR